MNRPSPFRFEPEPGREAGGPAFRFRVPADVSSGHDLFAALADGLWFPGWLGFTWDALARGLGDLTNLPDRRVILIHDRLPDLPDRDLALYLDALARGLAAWRSRPGVFEVVFPAQARGRIERLMAAGQP